MKYAVDKIENDIVVLENIENCEIKEVPITELPNNRKEGNILKYENDIFIKDVQEEINNKNIIANVCDIIVVKIGA